MRGKNIEISKQFVVMNSSLEYFCGLMYGGQLVWSHDYREAKPLTHESQFTTLQNLCSGEELLLEYIN